LIGRGWGRILLFGGTNTDTIRGFSTTAAYSSAKTGLGVLAKSAAKSGGGFGVTCNVICPGLVDTDETDEAARAYNREKRQSRAALTPRDIARASLAVLSNPAINGAILPVDQGLTL
jgi:NAD(P)-dependent dehydrogenase (short-subunit alcohol dehydrogenase family)